MTDWIGPFATDRGPASGPDFLAEFDVFYRASYHRAIGYAAKRARMLHLTYQDAQDCHGVAAMKAFRKWREIREYDTDARRLGWLFRVIRQEIYSLARSEGVEQRGVSTQQSEGRLRRIAPYPTTDLDSFTRRSFPAAEDVSAAGRHAMAVLALISQLPPMR